MEHRATQMNAQIAKHLNLAEELITEVQEWAKVLWVRINGMRSRFVSKKVVKMEKTLDGLAQALLEAGFTKANVWQKHGLTRIYTQSGFIDLTDEPKIKGGHSKQEKQQILDCLKKWNALGEGVTAPSKDWKQHLLRPQSQTIQDSCSAYHRDCKPKDWYYGAADEESF
jgi:hypothetical protein